MSSETQEQTATTSRVTWQELVKYAIAVLALVGFSCFIIYLMGKTTNASELEWTRAVYLLSGIEAIAFAAAGFIFGREVNRQRAQQAEKRASDAEARSAESLKKAVAFESKGYALASAIRARPTMAFKLPIVKRNFAGGPENHETIRETDILKNLVDDLFPKK